jgi:hypothetical protein
VGLVYDLRELPRVTIARPRVAGVLHMPMTFFVVDLKGCYNVLLG